jgi:hypothetical protein
MTFFIFSSDLYNGQDFLEGNLFPSPTAVTFSYQPFEGLVVRNSATSGSKEILEYDGSPVDTYEWEFAGVRSAAEACQFGGQLGLISTITCNYGSIDVNSLDTRQAFQKLSDFVKNILDSNVLA